MNSVSTSELQDAGTSPLGADPIDIFASRWGCNAGAMHSPPESHLNYQIDGGAGQETPFDGNVQAIWLLFSGRWGNYVFQLMNIFHIAERLGVRHVFLERTEMFPQPSMTINGIQIHAKDTSPSPAQYCLSGVFFDTSPLGQLARDLTPARRATLVDTYVRPLLVAVPKLHDVITRDDLIIHIRAGDIFQGDEGAGGANAGGAIYTQPPLSFYLLAADRAFRNRRGAIFVVAENLLNPVILPLVQALDEAGYPVTLRLGQDLPTDLAWLLAGRQVVFANGSIGIAAALLSASLKVGYFFRHNGTGTMQPIGHYIGDQIAQRVVLDEAGSYIAFGGWENTGRQRSEMCRFPVGKLHWEDRFAVQDDVPRLADIVDRQRDRQRRAAEPTVVELMDRVGLEIAGIIHVGAHVGQERHIYRAAGDVPCLYIEPARAAFAELTRNIRRFRQHFAVNAACSDVPQAAATLHLADNAGESSSLLPFAEHERIFPAVRFAGSETVVVRTLDEIIASEGRGHPFNLLVIDTQGADLRVLQGAQALLPQVDGVYVEVSEVPLYEGGCLFDEVTAFLRGFDLPLKWAEITLFRCGNAFYARNGDRPIPAPPSENRALGRPATQSSLSIWSEPEGAQGGNNGVRTGRFGFHTDSEPNAWWQVDLGEDGPIREIRAFNRMDECRERACSLRVLLSSDGERWRVVHDQAGRRFGGIDGRPLRVTLAQETARFVRLQLAADVALHLDEVEVY